MVDRIPQSKQELIEEMKEESKDFEPSVDEKDDDGVGEPDLEWAYGTLRNLVSMVAHGNEEFVMVEGDGGIGKTYNIKDTLRSELDSSQWEYYSGYTTPMELYKMLYDNRTSTLFLDDFSGITKNDKCVNILKAALDTTDDANVVHWRSSQPPKDDFGNELDKSFTFSGRIIMSFNDTPSNRHFDALETRGQSYNIDFGYDDRIEILREVAKSDSMKLDYATRDDTVDWIETVTQTAESVSIRTLEKVLNIRKHSIEHGGDWRKTALEVFDLNYEKEIIMRLNEKYDKEMKKVERYKEVTGNSQGDYYNKKNELSESNLFPNL